MPLSIDNAPDNANANQPQHVEPDASDAQPSGAVALKSVVKQLDVLLLNAAVWGAAILAAATGTTRILRVAAARGLQPFFEWGRTCDLRRATCADDITTFDLRPPHVALSHVGSVRRKS